jgi:hypothetical protein
MAIVFKPIGLLDINTEPTDLKQETDGRTIVSGDMQRCKNLRVDEDGVLKTRHGGDVLNTITLDGTPDFCYEAGGYRYVLGGPYIYRNESQIAEGIYVETPDFDPDGDSYASYPQTVEITCGTDNVNLFYTTDGTDPDSQSQPYSEEVSIQAFTWLKAIATKSGFEDSAIKSAYYSLTGGLISTETNEDNIITETDSNNIVNEEA